MRTRPVLLGFCVFFGLAWGACDKNEIKSDGKPIVGVLELPIAHRSGAPEPGDAARIEIGAGEIRVAGEPVLTLENGKVPASERNGYLLPKLKDKLAGKRVLAISVYAASPYATLARVIHTGFEAGARELAFRVRKPGTSTDTGWMVLHNVHFTPSAEDGGFGEANLLPWEKFTAHWEDSLSACKAGVRSGDCGYSPLGKALGGKLDMMVRVRGTGVALRFRQTGAPPQPEKEKPKKPKVEMLEGIKGAPAAAAEPEEPEPATEHVFTLRADQAAEVNSPISDITKPVCGSVSCPAVVDAEGISMSGTVLSLIGAAFPEGTPEPKLAFVLPPQQ
jgi:hypothetical protein